MARRPMKTEPSRVEHCFDTGKTRYSKEKQVKTVINQMIARGAPNTLRPYKCPVCGDWHMTKSLKQGL